MGSLRDLVDGRRETIRSIATQHKEGAINVFESVANGPENEHRYINFVVVMAGGSSLSDLGGIQFELSVLLGVDVDVIYERSLKLRDAHNPGDAVPPSTVQNANRTLRPTPRPPRFRITKSWWTSSPRP